MKKLLFGIIVLMFFSCKKESSTETEISNDCRILQITTSSNKIINKFEYTADNKISKNIEYDSISGDIIFYSIYSYTSNQVTKTCYFDNNEIYYTDYYELNEKGLAIKSILHNSYTYFYEYDDAGYLIKKISLNDTTDYQYKNGTMILAISKGSDRNIDSAKYEYYDFEIPLNMRALLLNDQQLFTGMNSDLALKKTISWLTHDPTHTLVSDYSYGFDSNNKLSLIKGSYSYLNGSEYHRYENKIELDCH